MYSIYSNIIMSIPWEHMFSRRASRAILFAMIDYSLEKKTTLDAALMQLFTIVQLLRSKDGCPWDREQTHKSVATNLLDETYEYIDTLVSKDIGGQKEEIGDVLLNAMMLLEMHQESDPQFVIDSLNDVCDKLIRRHPHVFSDHVVSGSSEVLDVWNSIKVNVEGKTHDSDDFFSRVPASLPPLEKANEIQKKIRKVGFDWPNVEGVVEKVKEELSEVVVAKENPDEKREDLEMELGDLLFAVVNLCRYLGYNPSVALHRSNQKMQRRFNALYSLAKQRGIQLDQDHVDEMDELWNEIKAIETRDAYGTASEQNA
jgi:MazG family protein